MATRKRAVGSSDKTSADKSRGVKVDPAPAPGASVPGHRTVELYLGQGKDRQLLFRGGVDSVEFTSAESHDQADRVSCTATVNSVAENKLSAAATFIPVRPSGLVELRYGGQLKLYAEASNVRAGFADPKLSLNIQVSRHVRPSDSHDIAVRQEILSGQNLVFDGSFEDPMRATKPASGRMEGALADDEKHSGAHSWKTTGPARFDLNFDGTNTPKLWPLTRRSLFYVECWVRPAPGNSPTMNIQLRYAVQDGSGAELDTDTMAPVEVGPLPAGEWTKLSAVMDHYIGGAAKTFFPYVSVVAGANDVFHWDDFRVVDVTDAAGPEPVVQPQVQQPVVQQPVVQQPQQQVQQPVDGGNTGGTAITDTGTGTGGTVVTTPVVVPVPDVTATASDVTADSCTLTWPKVTDATGYFIYAKATADPAYVKIGDVLPSGNADETYKATGLTDSDRDFIVVAFTAASPTAAVPDAATPGRPHVPKFVAPQVAVVPDPQVVAQQGAQTVAPAPADITAVASAVTADACTLTWPKVDGATGYVVYTKGDGETAYTKLGDVTPSGNADETYSATALTPPGARDFIVLPVTAADPTPAVPDAATVGRPHVAAT